MRDDIDTASSGDSPLPARFRLGGSLGSGGMADVYRAHDQHLDRPVAVKVFGPRADPVALRRFDDEAHALARLSHPGLVSIFDVGVHRDRPYLVMRLVQGDTLQSRLLDGPLPPADVLLLGARLADALAHVHGRDMIHRDVKPSNILLDEDDNPFLTDFGIALLVGATRLTDSNEIIGTPAYLAPEQVLGREIGPAVDVYGLALMLIECLTGEMEYPGGNKVEAALARLHRPPRIPAGLPVEFASLLVTMTATEPARRPPAAHCAQRLLSLYQADALSSWHPNRRTRAKAAAVESPWWAQQSRTARMRGPKAKRSTVSRLWRPVVAASLATGALATGLVLALSTPQAAASGESSTGPATAVVNNQADAATSTTTPAKVSTTAPPAVVVHHSTLPTTTVATRPAPPAAPRPGKPDPGKPVLGAPGFGLPGHGIPPGRHHGGKNRPPH
jgi:serine/threonine protein kinase